MGHATAAYLGYLSGYEYIWQAVGDNNIRQIVENAMKESASALSKVYGVPIGDILTHVSDLLLRFENRALGDTTSRVGADSFRKTGADDRLAGAIIFCENAGVESVNICEGLAAAMFFNNDDAGTQKLCEMIKINGIETVLREHCGIGHGENEKTLRSIIEKISKIGKI